MIVFDLECRGGLHRFEAWFASSDDYAAQQRRGLVSCPHCGSTEVAKAPMAPRVGKKGNQLAPRAKKMPVASEAMPPEAAIMIEALAAMQTKALEDSTWVGGGFAEASRAMHYGERKRETIHGQATPFEAAELHEEGIPVTPLPFPVTPPDRVN